MSNAVRTTPLTTRAGNQTPAVTARPTPPQPDAAPVNPQERVDPLLQLAERAIAKTSLRYLNADQHTPWQIMHGMVALRTDFELIRGNSKINCVEFLSDAPMFRGEYWWQVTEHGGRAHPFSVPYAFEGHANQFLALLSMSNLPLTHEFNVDGEHTVTMADMIENAKMTVNTREEITWTLWFLTQYLDIDEEWTNADGEAWSLEELVRVQTQAPVVGTPCGGCHGLFAIAYARNSYLAKHGRLRGIYFQAEQKINRHIELARSMQNNDGSFSTEWFKGPGHSRDFNERIKASGHMLEWLMMAMPQRRLNEAWIRRAVASIATDLIHNAAQPAECGPLYHALNSLIMYRDRVKPHATPGDSRPQLADQTDDGSAAEVTPSTASSTHSARKEVAAQDIMPKLEIPAADVATAPVDPPVRGERAKSNFSRTITPGSRLARKAAERLADVARASAQESTTGAKEQHGPGLLTAPQSRPSRIAIEPNDRTAR